MYVLPVAMIKKGQDGVAAETQLAKLIKSTDKRAKYDTKVKKLLANEAILAWILKTCTEEFAPYSPQEIIKCIEEKPEVSLRAVHADDLDADERLELIDSDKSISGGNTEDNSLKEQTIYYDIRLNARTPGEKRSIQLIINIEAQLDTAPGYPIEKRAIYYCCRLISGQYGTVFSHSEYGKIRKVYSIWFCPDAAKKRANTIKKISLKEFSVYGSMESRKEDTDLIQAVIVNLGNPDEEVDNEILRLMNVLLSSKTDVEKKQKVMQEEFHIAMTMELESEVAEMCNLSQGIYNEGVNEGIKEGIEEGIEEGIREGMNKGLDRGIEGAVTLLRDAGMEDSVIFEKIMAQYNLSSEAAEKYVYALR